MMIERIVQQSIPTCSAVADAVRTSLGPRGMDKMIQSASGDVTITNDGATILKQMSVLHPVARMVRVDQPCDHLVLYVASHVRSTVSLSK